MKVNILRNLVGGLLLSSTLLAGCDNAEYTILNNQAFILQTKTNPNTSIKVFIDKHEVTTDVNVRLTDIAHSDLVFELLEDSELLDKYNKDNFTSYRALPAEQYRVASRELVVKAGESISETMGICIQPLTAQMKDSGEKYALAFTLKSKDNETEILRPGRNIVYLLDPAIVTSVPVFSSQNNGVLNLKDDLSLEEWTLEYCVNMSKLGKKIGELNNQAIFAASSKLGEGDGQIYVRFGDAPIEGNRLQIKTQGTQMNSNMLFEQNRWYQIAWVCSGTKLQLYVDGKLDNSMDLPGKVTNLDKRIKIGNTDYLKAEMQLSELRIWQRALSQREIANNLYVTNPQAKGLYAYFKFNEGTGVNFTDATGNGSTGFFATPVWKNDVRLNAK